MGKSELFQFHLPSDSKKSFNPSDWIEVEEKKRKVLEVRGVIGLKECRKSRGALDNIFIFFTFAKKKFLKKMGQFPSKHKNWK